MEYKKISANLDNFYRMALIEKVLFKIKMKIILIKMFIKVFQGSLQSMKLYF